MVGKDAKLSLSKDASINGSACKADWVSYNDYFVWRKSDYHRVGDQNGLITMTIFVWLGNLDDQKGLTGSEWVNYNDHICLMHNTIMVSIQIIPGFKPMHLWSSSWFSSQPSYTSPHITLHESKVKGKKRDKFKEMVYVPSVTQRGKSTFMLRSVSPSPPPATASPSPSKSRRPWKYPSLPQRGHKCIPLSYILSMMMMEPQEHGKRKWVPSVIWS